MSELLPGPLSTEVIRTSAALEALAPEWWEVWREDGTATPFQSPAWLLPWWQHLGEGELLAIAVREGAGRLLGLLPLYVYTEKQNGRRKLLLLGAGTSDYLGGIFHPHASAEPVAAALACLVQWSHQWDEAHLHQLTPQSPLLSAARELGWAVFPSEACSKLLLPGAGGFRGKLRDNLRYYRKRAERSYEVSFVTATEVNALDIFQALVKLHGSRWQSRGEAGVLASERVQAAHLASIPMLQAAGLLRIHALLLDDQLVAVVYGLADPPNRQHRTVYCYLNGFDPLFAPFSPGTLMIGFAAEEAAAEGIQWLDMLRGEEEYKRHWNPELRPTYGFALPASGGKQSVDHGPGAL